MAWYTDLTDASISELKYCLTPFGLKPEWAKRALTECHKEDKNSVQVFCCDQWLISMNQLNLTPDLTYRLNPDWKRPEKKKKSHWEYCNVSVVADSYVYERHSIRWDLHNAFSSVGFGGIEFKEYSLAWSMHLMRGGLEDMPLVPHRVRFWVED